MTHENCRRAPAFPHPNNAPAEHVDRKHHNHPVGAWKGKKNDLIVLVSRNNKERIDIEVFIDGLIKTNILLLPRSEEGEQEEEDETDHRDLKAR